MILVFCLTLVMYLLYSKSQVYEKYLVRGAPGPQEEPQVLCILVSGGYNPFFFPREKKKVLVPNSEKKKKSCSQQRKNFLGAGNGEKKVKVTGNGEKTFFYVGNGEFSFFFISKTKKQQQQQIRSIEREVDAREAMRFK